MTEIFGIDDDLTTNVEIDELESDRQTLIALLVDDSGSMHSFEGVMVDSLEKFKSAIIGAKESDEMLISKTMFGSTIQTSGYQFIGDMSTNYTASGMTKLYDCIVESQERLIDGNGNGYMEKLQQNGIRPKAVVAIFSDGDDTASKSSISDARRAIEFLRSKEIIVAFVAFGDEAQGIAEKLGIEDKNILEVSSTESDLRKVFTILSKSAISASKSAGPGNLADSFFTV